MTSKSRAKAIDAMCKACIYDPGFGGTWRQQVENCTNEPCPLFPWRPRPENGPRTARAWDDRPMSQAFKDAAKRSAFPAET